MSSLTGDFPAVFQVSGGTINRLLASMHQNDRQDPTTPSFPHSLEFRYGDEYTYERPAGLARVQIGVPRLRLEHGSTDRFGLEVAIRAYTESDPWHDALTEFANGTVTAQYALTRPDPSWPGWSGVDVSRYLAVRLVEGSVNFSGEVGGGWGVMPDLTDPGVEIPRFTEQVAELLRTSFTPSPIEAPGLGPGRLRSLVGGGGSAVAGPIEIGGSTGGQIESIGEEWLAGRDAGLGLSSDFILARLRESLQGLQSDIVVRVDFGIDSTVYHVRVSPGAPEWSAAGDRASITIRISASATTASVLPNATVNVVQTVELRFDAANKTFTLTPLPASVTSDVSGPFGGAIEDALNGAVQGEVRNRIGPVLQSAVVALNRLLAGGDQLGAQLRRMDRWLTLRFNEAVFRSDGVAVLGRATPAPRAKPVVTFSKNEDTTAFTALATWIPGGQVKRFRWWWIWPSADLEATNTKRKYTDRFYLRGPLATDPHGMPYLGDLPGLHGNGGVVLNIDGSVVDERSGALVPVEAGYQVGFNYTFPWELPPWITDLHWREGFRLDQGEGPRPDELRLGTLRKPIRRATGFSANTLLVTEGGTLTEATLETVEQAVTGHERRDAGLLTAAIFADGESAKAGSGVVERLRSLESNADVPLVVAETVDSVLWDALALPTGTNEPSYRLISPSGGVTWSHDGALSAAELTTALTNTLMASPPPAAEVVVGGAGPGTRLWEAAESLTGAGGEGLPSPPLGRHADGPRLAVFVDSRSADSVEEVGRLAGEAVVFVNGGVEGVRTLNSQLETAVDAIPDPGGRIAASLGIDCWPTTVRLDERGEVIESWVGAGPPSADADGDEP